MNHPNHPFANTLPQKCRPAAQVGGWRRRLKALRGELADLAYQLDVRGRRDAADVTMMISARLAEICGEPAAARPDGRGRNGGHHSLDN